MSSFYFIITGPPGSGKTALIEALHQRSTNIVTEAARRVLRDQRAIDGRGTGERDPALFIELMAHQMAGDYSRAMLNASPTVFDRSFPDLLAFLDYYSVNAPHIRAAAAKMSFNRHVFWCPPWEDIYANDEERTLDFEGARAFGALTRAGYEQLGYTLIDVPFAPIKERADFVSDTLRGYLGDAHAIQPRKS